MFTILKKKIDRNLYAPVAAKIVTLENVPDPVFAMKMMGDGVAFDLQDDVICAPCDGVITMIANTKHAFGMLATNGAEVLLHVGLDTVKYKGEGFDVFVSSGSKVKKGTPIMKVDREFFRLKEVNLITPMVITNAKEYTLEVEEGKEVLKEDIVLVFK